MHRSPHPQHGYHRQPAYRPLLSRRRVIALLAFLAAGWPACWPTSGQAQIAAPATRGSVATLSDQLINRLRATTEDRQLFLRLIAAKTEVGQFERGRVLAFERYAMRKNERFPFPHFERAMRAESRRLGVYLPPVELMAAPRYRSLR